MAVNPGSDPLRVNLSWLIRLRWGAIAGQALTTVAVDRFMDVPLPLGLLGALIGVELVTNVGATVWARRAPAVREWHLAALMGLDVLVLTGLLYLTGGPFNPFSFLYLVYIALAAVLLGAGWTWALVLLSLVGSGVLFLRHRPLVLQAETHDEHMSVHLRGMWVAYGVAAAFIVYFLMRVMRALAARDAELAAARTASARAERLASLATPLGTIAVVAKELERHLAAGPAVDDVRLIRAQVDRCRAILDQIAVDAGAHAGEGPVPVAVEELIAASLAELAAEPRVRVELDEAARAARLPLPPRALAQALRGVVKNAQDASPPGAEVVVRAAAAAGGLVLEVADAGAGMPQEVLAHAGEPFFTTKPPGQGMGLGLFLTRAVLERLGGRLTLDSAPGRGTVATLSVPAPATNDRIARTP